MFTLKAWIGVSIRRRRNTPRMITYEKVYLSNRYLYFTQFLLFPYWPEADC